MLDIEFGLGKFMKVWLMLIVLKKELGWDVLFDEVVLLILLGECVFK